MEMAARAGIETAAAFLQAVIKELGCRTASSGGAQHGAQNEGELAEIIREWAKLLPEIKFALLALVRTARSGAG